MAEVELGVVRLGDSAIFTVKAHRDKSFTAHIVQVRQPTEGLASGTTKPPVRFDVVLDVENPDLLLCPGMSAEVQLGPNS